MQSFVINIEGKTVTLDVDPGDIIKTVKEKLKVKISIPCELQRLSYNGKPLEDEKSLLDYNIEKGSNLRLSLQVQNWLSSEVCTRLPVDWEDMANRAKFKVDEEIAEKKEMHTKLMKQKVEEFRNVKKIKAELRYYETAELEASNQILKKEEEIKAQERKLEEVHKLLLASKKEKHSIAGKRDTAYLNISNKRKELANVQSNLNKIGDEVEELLVVKGERLSRRSEELEQNNLAMKELLNATISKKESLLECPVCYQVSSPPIYKCTKEHLICSKCLPKMKNKCPTCRSGFARDVSIFRLAEENWTELQILKSKLEERAGDEVLEVKINMPSSSKMNPQEAGYYDENLDWHSGLTPPRLNHHI